MAGSQDLPTSPYGGGGSVTSVTGTAGRITSTGGATPQIDLATAGTAGTYASPSSVTTDAYGRVTAITAGSAPTASGWSNGGTVVYLTTSTDDVSIGSNTPVTNRKLSITNEGTNLGISVVTLASTDNVVETFVSGEANLRFSVIGTGSHLWGAGGASAQDVRLYRSATSTLTVDNGAGGSAGLSILGTTSMQRTQYQTTTTAATPYAVTATDNIVFANSGVAQTINLPAAAAGLTGRTITVKRIKHEAWVGHGTELALADVAILVSIEVVKASKPLLLRNEAVTVLVQHVEGSAG